MRADRKSGLDPDEQGFVQQDAGRVLAAVNAHGCPAPALLNAAGAGALTPDLSAAVQAHLDRCAICRHLAADLLQIEPDFDALQQARIRAAVTRRRPPFLRIAAVAASLAVVASGAMLLSNAARPGWIPGAAPPARVLAPGPLVSALAADKLAPPMRAGALSWRASGEHYDLDLATALKPYSENKFKAAAAALERVSARYPDNPEPLMYLGVCQLLMDRPIDAERTLRRAVPLGGPAVDDVRWYLAVAAYQNGKRADARQLLARLCGGTSRRAAEACLAHDQIGDSQ